MQTTCALLLLGTLAVACAASPSGAPEAPTPQPIPSDLQADVGHAVRLGPLIHMHDMWGARATDAVIATAGGAIDPRVRGWVVTEERDQATVAFLGGHDDHVAIFARARFKGHADTPTVELSPRGEAPTPTELQMFSARQTAIHAEFGRCSNWYNTVVLPGALLARPGWLVYLLAATRQPKVIVVGGHYRVEVSPDGDRVTAVKAFSKDCLNLPFSTEANGDPSQWALFSTLVLDAPAETHVFLSLLHRRPMYVLTKRGLWEVRARDITFLGPLPSRHAGAG
jgi:hypothetical protein